ncbi:cytochrome P450 [Thozetella sp. PMI_491]|nr:cytochrome P450 [Thozetella sp. PMI_491]
MLMNWRILPEELIISFQRLDSSTQLTYWLALATIVGLAAFLFSTIYNLFFHPLRNYPGPRTWASSSIPYSLSVATGNGHLRMLELHTKYGEAVRVAPNRLSFMGQDVWAEVNGHKKTGQNENGKAPLFYPDGNNALISADRGTHSRQRRVLAHGFSAQAMLEQQPLIKQYVDLLIKQIHDKGDGGRKALDAVAWLNFTTFDIIGDLAFGEPFGSLSVGHYHPWVSMFLVNIKTTIIIHLMHQFRFFSTLLTLLIPRSAKKKLENHRESSRRLVDKRLAMGAYRPDFITAMTSEKNNKAALSKEEIYGNAALLVIAGSETTATALAGHLYYLCRTPHAMKKLTEEVRQSFKSEEEIDMLSVQKLEYLGACIQEALRIYPPVPGAATRVAPPEGNIFFGNYIRGGTSIDIWQWSMYHSPAYFKDPEEFVPERWQGDPRFAQDQSQVYQPFSFGPRNCIGKNLAYAEMRLILCRLLWNFDIKYSTGSEDWINRQGVYFLWHKPSMYLHFTPREVLQS